MGSLIAVVSKRGVGVFNEAIMMLNILSHRGSDAFGVASSQRVTIKKSINELRKEKLDSQALIAHNFAKIVSCDKAQPIRCKDFTFVFDGRFFPHPPGNKETTLVDQFVDTKAKAEHLIRSLNGDYTFAVAEDEEILVGRDPVGTLPLYFGENDCVSAVASEQKALRKIKITEVKSFPPGKLAILRKNGFRFKAARNIMQPIVEKIDMVTAAEKLKEALVQSTKERVSDLRRVAVAFSGGVDSSVIASLVKQSDVAAELIYVSLTGWGDAAFAENVAEILNMPFHHFTYSIDDLRNTLPRVLWLVEKKNPVCISIAVPFFWVAQQSAQLGCHVLMAGQGGDELFGGYRRYLDDYGKQGLTGLQRKLYKDLILSHETNFQRDNRVCAFNGVELRMPFTDWRVIQFALGLPPNLKISSPQDTLRKRVLRYTAKLLGLPKSVTEKPKKAIQYTTGVNQAIKRLASEERLNLRGYLERRFSEIPDSWN